MSPEANIRYDDSLPRARRWKPRSFGQDVHILREQLDDLRCHQVCWDPYAEDRIHHPLQPVAFYTGCLKFGAIVEPYHPQRVLRQWSYVQTIPPSPLAPYRAQRGSTSATYQVAYTFEDQRWESWNLYVLTEESRGRRCVTLGETVPEYTAWYESISHRFVQNPESRTGIQATPVVDDYPDVSY